LKFAGANSHTKADEWLEKGKAFVFVFEIGAEPNSKNMISLLVENILKSNQKPNWTNQYVHQLI
jgi:hypothetical protein